MDGSESDKLSPELGFFPEHVTDQTEQMKTLLLNCYQFQQKVLSQKSEITKLKERISDAENIETNDRIILQERISKLNCSIFESMIFNEKLCSVCQTDDISSETKSSTGLERKSVLSSSSISSLNKFDDSMQVGKYKSELMNTSLGTRMQQCHLRYPLRRSVSLSSLGSVYFHNIDTKQINTNFLCPGNTDQCRILQHTYFTTNCKNRMEIKNTSNLSSSKPFFYQVGVEKNIGCKSSGVLNDGESSKLSLDNNKDNVCPAQERQGENDNDSGNASGQTSDYDSLSSGLANDCDLDAGRGCGSLKNILPFKEDNQNSTLDTCQNIEGKQQNQLNKFEEKLISHGHEQNEVKENLESDGAYGARGLSIDDHSCRSNISKHSKEEEKEKCEVDGEILPGKLFDSENSKSAFKVTKDIPVSSLDHERHFNYLIGKETSIDSSTDVSEYCSLSKEGEATNGNTDCQQTDRVSADQQSEHDPQSSNFASSDNGVKNAMPKTVNGINSSFPLNLLGQVVSQSNQLQNQTLLPSSQMISKAVFHKLAQELTKVKADNTTLKKEYFMMYMRMQQIHTFQNTCSVGEENAQMNIDLKEEAAPMRYLDDDHEQSSSFFFPTDDNLEREREEQDKAAQMHVDEAGLHKLSIPTNSLQLDRTKQSELEKENKVAQMHVDEAGLLKLSIPASSLQLDRTKQSELEKEPTLQDEAFENQAAQVQYMRDLEKKIESLHSMLAVETARRDELSKMLNNERERFSRDIKHLKEKLRGKTKSEGSKSHESNRIRSSNSDSKITKSNNPHIHPVKTSGCKVDTTSQYHHQGARPKHKNTD